jgi:hypothetical protein
VAVVGVTAKATTVAAELVTLRNVSAAAVNLTGYKLTSKSTGRTFTLPAYALAPGATVRVHTGAGTNGAGNLYLRSTTAIWNDLHDTATLRRPTAVVAWVLAY